MTVTIYNKTKNGTTFVLKLLLKEFCYNIVIVIELRIRIIIILICNIFSNSGALKAIK